MQIDLLFFEKSDRIASVFFPRKEMGGKELFFRQSRGKNNGGCVREK